MDQIRAYIFSVGAAGLLCAVTGCFVGKESAAAKALKLVTGLFLLLAILRPIGNFAIDDLQELWEDYSANAQSAVSQGEKQSKLALQNSIKERIATYILDKGATYGANLSVQVLLDDTFPPNIASVSIHGDISPYAKQALHRVLTQDLGLENEEILWQ